MAIFNSYVSLPEGIYSDILSDILSGILSDMCSGPGAFHSLLKKEELHLR